jgi:hypothetical protein
MGSEEQTLIEIETPSSGQTYRIGAVARLTGIPPDTLRVWERRYAVVTPIRSEAGTRLYSADDVGRLTLIKRLVDNGDAISHVARLSLPDLRERVRGLSLRPLDETETRPCRVGILGPTLPAVMAADLGTSAAGARDRHHEGRAAPLELVGLFSDEARFRAEARDLDLDLVLIEQPTIHHDQLHRVSDLVAASGAARAVVVYQFASRAVLERLESQRITAKHAPLEAAELKRWCATGQATADSAMPLDVLGDIDLTEPIPRRRFDSAALARIATASPTVRCECPHHLVQLVSNLAAFETYSQECENRNADDAALHAFLHAATAHARATLESALARVIEAEGIEL